MTYKCENNSVSLKLLIKTNSPKERCPTLWSDWQKIFSDKLYKTDGAVWNKLLLASKLIIYINGGRTAAREPHAAFAHKFSGSYWIVTLHKKLRLYFKNMLSSAWNYFYLSMHFRVIKLVHVFTALSTRVISTVMTNCRMNTSKNQGRIIFQEL